MAKQETLVSRTSAGKASSSSPQGPGLAKRLLAGVPMKLSVGFIVLLLICAIFAPLITGLVGVDPYSFNTDLVDSAQGGVPKGGNGGISSDHWFGVEPLTGRDVFARTVYGARTSFVVAVSAVGVSAVIGVSLGLISGYRGRYVDQLLSRIADLFMSFPTLIFMIAIISVLPATNRTLMLIIVLAAFGWTQLFRVVRSQTLSMKRREFIEAALSAGAPQRTIIFKEILPNIMGSIIVMSTLAIPTFIGLEASLSFLGVGVVAPTASWGQMISNAVPWFTVIPTYFLIPGLCLFGVVLSFTVVGDRLQTMISANGVR